MELYYREFGKGSPILILHGLFGFSDNWQTIAKALAEDHLVITPDLRNHGRSPHLPSHTYQDMAEDLRQFLESHWMFSSTVIGHSMGGKAAMQLALSHPDFVERLVVVDIEPSQADDNHSGIFQALFDLNLPSQTDRKAAEALLEQRVPDWGTRQFLLKNITRDETGKLSWKMNLPVLWEYFSEILGPVHGTTFDKPTLFVRGSRSDYIKDAKIPFIKSMFPQAQIATIEGAGHWVHADKPQELLAVLKDFLT